MTLSLEKKEERELQRRLRFDRVMPIDKFKPITCLQCRRCQPVPETDFSQYPQRVPVIFCQKQGRRVPAQLTSCALADPRPARPKKLHKLWVGTTGNFGDLGDYTRVATPAMLVYLRARWLVASKIEIETATGKTTLQLEQIVREHQIAGEALGKTRKQFAGGKGEGKNFTPEQTKWLQTAYANDGIWPGVPTYNISPEKRTEIERRKAFILEQVALRGPQWDWKQITHHLAKQRAKANAQRSKNKG